MSVAIVGGGVSGLTLGGLLASEGIDVTIYERKNRVGKKLLATGNGRANVSNVDLKYSHWHSESELPFDPGRYFSPEKRDAFFERLGLDLVEEDRGKLYPRTLQAQTVLNALRRAFASFGGIERTDTFIASIERRGGTFALLSNEAEYAADVVVVATGGRSMPESGSDGKGYGLLEGFGHRLTRTFPGISALECRSPYLKHLSGTKIEGEIALFKDGRRVDRRSGEILFAKDGVSGPPVLDLARTVAEEKAEYTVSIPMINHLEQSGDFRAYLEGRSYIPQTVEAFLEGVVSKKWIHVVLKTLNLKRDESIDLLDYDKRAELLDLLFAFTLPVTGVRGFDYAQVTCGGIALDEFTEDLESKKCPGLFAIGEVLDVDGDCGGYNIHWAMASAHRVFEKIIK
ncbi:MAG: aminoacetone oxidase family FAD-binding enzyme [Peptoniphilus sp.]|nr:aminoacetone oxidase family FAD-binding enzyme [Peptoniphilus sp.]MDD7363596.1 aminoacetone oxidase family FAD-binding enzyme [Bacillota bacterium]MDY6045213.1 aminoacetone oxidase family FAD-binding enzyme [Peptoniphilus sp.]